VKAADVRAARARTLAYLGELDRAASEAETVSKGTAATGTGCCNAARALALASAAAARDSREPAAERLAGLALADRLPAVLAGTAALADNAERLAFAQMACDTKRYAAAARLWGEAMEAGSRVADDLKAGRRYDAACAAALASSGQGRDDPPPDDEAKARLRSQALAWLRADLALWAKQLETDPAEARRTLTHWTRDPDLTSVREPGALAKLPEAERADWRALWAEVDRLLKEAGKAP
jgi:hypothetical protein